MAASNNISHRIAILYSEDAIRCLKRVFARKGLDIEDTKLKTGPRSVYLDAKIIFHGTRVGRLHYSYREGVLDTDIHFSIFGHSFPANSDKWEDRIADKSSRCIKGRPKIRKWAAWAAKQFLDHLANNNVLRAAEHIHTV